MTEKELKRAQKSLVKQIEKHDEKLKKYLENSDSCDNHGYLKKATSFAERHARINERVASLKKQMRGFKLDFDICTELLKKIG